MMTYYQSEKCRLITLIRMDKNITVIFEDATFKVSKEDAVDSLFINSAFKTEPNVLDNDCESPTHLYVEYDFERYRNILRSGVISDLCYDFAEMCERVSGSNTVGCTTFSFGKEEMKIIKEKLAKKHCYLSAYFIGFSSFSVVHGSDVLVKDSYHFFKNKISVDAECAIIPGIRWMC
uniref:20 kDa protein n=1 Tax=Persimmon virus B TaxID=1493829 RepID=A0A0A8JCW3_9CLOS|nr:20 kDa protein [Persimmon virus B]